MKLFIGWLLGLGTAWAALAIWQRVPESPDIDDTPPLAEAPTISKEWMNKYHPGDCTGMGYPERAFDNDTVNLKTRMGLNGL